MINIKRFYIGLWKKLPGKGIEVGLSCNYYNCLNNSALYYDN